MPTSTRTTAALDLSELSLELARLDLSRPDKLGDEIVDAVVRYFATDRVSLALGCDKTSDISKGYFRGFEVPVGQWQTESIIISRICQTRQPVLVSNAQEHSDLQGVKRRYRTDAFASFPLVFHGRLQGVLSISNLSTRQVELLQQAGADLDVVLTQLGQLARMINASNRAAARTRTTDDVGLIARLNERLEENSDTRDVIGIFAELVNEILPTQALSIIYSRVREPQVGAISVHQPVHITELERAFEGMCHQWQRRHKRAASLSLADARILGQELICSEGECTPELMLVACEVFPVFLDNDLFAIVCLATTAETLTDRKVLATFNVMAHQLCTYLKKRMLLALNTEMQTHDSLTGLINERQFYQMLEREFDRASRYSVPLSLLFVDIDHFKDINDSYGFETGDQVLLELSRIISENMRTTDFASRYSGERFVVVLPETPYSSSELMADRLRRYIENHSFYIPNTSVFVKVTASVGVASYLDHKPASVAQFIEYADTALYFAKRNGRNQVVGYSYVIKLMVGDTKNQG